MASAAPSRVVIIDDTVDLRELLSVALTRGGYQVAGEAGDGRSGVELVRETDPDVVILDLSLPVMDGLEALPLIRGLCPEARIVVLSGFSEAHMGERTRALGADDFVQKGIPLGRLLDHVAGGRAGVAGRRPPTLSLVPPPADEAVIGALTGSPSGHSAFEPVVELAPYAVVEVVDAPGFAIARSNAAARDLLGTAAPGTPLGQSAPDIARLASLHRHEERPVFEVETDGGTVEVTARHSAGMLLLYLEPVADEVTALRRAIATTAHEVRGPVAVLGGVAEMIVTHEGDLSDSQRDRLLSAVARQARVLDSLTADLLTAAQIQRGSLRIELQELDPATAVEAVLSERYDVALDVRDRRRVQADPSRVEQMLSNLIGNAHKYGAAPYSVVVAPAGDLVRIEVHDCGVGVPEGFRDQLFQEFSRAVGTSASGTGLGLFVVRTLAEAQGGGVSYEPAPGGGSIFSITLPAVRDVI